jgi:Reverse transcriptase (RNA-dependent DNA polymerase)
VQQGCPLAPLLFSLVLRVLLLKIEEIVPDLKLNLWYLDDGHLAGSNSALLKCLEIIKEFGPSLGLYINMRKCVIFGENVGDFPVEVIRAGDGINVLGSPVGSKNFVSTEVNRKVCEAALTLFKSQALNDPQKELLLLRSCSGTPKLVYWLRTCVPDYIENELKGFDRVVDDALQHIIGSPLGNEDRVLAHLPLSMGGLGVPSAFFNADAAFVASVGSSWFLQKSTTLRFGFNEAILRLTSKGAEVPVLINMLEATPPSTPIKGFSQALFMNSVNRKIREDIYVAAGPKKKIIMEGRSCKASSMWLTVIPNRWSDTEIDPSSFRALLKYSIGMPLMSVEQKCPDCHKIQDIFGYHALSCKVASGSIDKHDSIINAISGALTNANIPHTTEIGNPMNKTKQRPGDIFMNGFDNYGCAYFDVSVINNCAESHWKRSVKGQLEGAKIRYDEKMKKYPDLGALFKPLVVESTGGWHAYSFDYLTKISEHIVARTGVFARDALNSILSVTSLRLQINQGTMLVRRCLGLRGW